MRRKEAYENSTSKTNKPSYPIAKAPAKSILNRSDCKSKSEISWRSIWKRNGKCKSRQGRVISRRFGNRYWTTKWIERWVARKCCVRLLPAFAFQRWITVIKYPRYLHSMMWLTGKRRKTSFSRPGVSWMSKTRRSRGRRKTRVRLSWERYRTLEGTISVSLLSDLNL